MVISSWDFTIRPFVFMGSPRRISRFNPLPEFASAWRHYGPRNNSGSKALWDVRLGQCLLLAQSGHPASEFQCPLSGVKQTLLRHAAMSAFGGLADIVQTNPSINRVSFPRV